MCVHSLQVLISGHCHTSLQSRHGLVHDLLLEPSSITTTQGTHARSENVGDGAKVMSVGTENKDALKDTQSYRTEDMSLFRRITIEVLEGSARDTVSEGGAASASALGLVYHNTLLALVNSIGQPEQQHVTDRLKNNMPSMLPEELFELARQASEIESGLSSRINNIRDTDSFGGAANTTQVGQELEEVGKRRFFIISFWHDVQQEVMVRRDEGRFPPQLLQQLPWFSFVPLPNDMTNPDSDWLKAHGVPPDVFTNVAYPQNEVQAAVDRMQQSVVNQGGTQFQLSQLQALFQQHAAKRPPSWQQQGLPDPAMPDRTPASPMPQPAHLGPEKIKQSMQTAVLSAGSNELRARVVGEDVISFEERLLQKHREQTAFMDPTQATAQPPQPANRQTPIQDQQPYIPSRAPADLSSALHPPINRIDPEALQARQFYAGPRQHQHMPSQPQPQQQQYPNTIPPSSGPDLRLLKCYECRREKKVDLCVRTPAGACT